MKYIALFILIIGLSSCSTFNCTPLEKYLGNEENLISLGYTIAKDLTNTAFPPLTPRNPNKPLLATTFVNNNNLQETSKFTRTLQSHIASGLVQLGYTVQEIHLRKDLVIQPESGETMLTRNLENMHGDYKAQAVLVGTISITNRTMYITARLVNPKTTNIISAKDYKFCMDDNVLAMFGLQRQTSELYGDCIDEPRQPLLNHIF